MAADWIKIRVDLLDDPAVITLAGVTSLDSFGVAGRLVAIWSWADRHTRDGKVRGVSKKWLDDFVECNGFAAAMIAVGWLRETKTGLTFPRFKIHNGESAKARALTAQRVRAHREKRKRNDVSVTEALPEKRREEGKKKKKKTSSSSRRKVQVNTGKPPKAARPPWDGKGKPPSSTGNLDRIRAEDGQVFAEAAEVEP